MRQNQSRTGYRLLLDLTVLVILLSPGLASADGPASPVDVPPGWQRLGPFGGKVIDVAYAPSDPNIVYALLENKTVPVYKSTDNGKTWTVMPVPYHIILPQSIAVSPVNPDLVLFAEMDNLYRSCDGGLTWAEQVDVYPNIIRFSPANPNKVYFNTDGNLYRSTDAGEHWEMITDQRMWRFSVDPFQETYIYATNIGENKGFFISRDDGLSWELLGFQSENIRKIVTGKEPGTIYFIKYYDNIVWKTTDYGVTWSVLTDSFASDILDLDVNVLSKDELFITLEDFQEPFNSNIWHSADDGFSWRNIPSRWCNLLYDNVEIDPSDTSHLIAFERWFGMHFTWDSGANWTQSGSVFPGIELFRVALSPVISGLMLVQTKGDGYVLQSTDSGKTWEYTHFRKQFGVGDFVFSYRHCDRVFFAVDCLYRSNNQGVDWEDVTPAGFGRPYSLAVNPANDDIVLCGDMGGRIIRSDDGGDTWTEVYNADKSSVYIRHIRFKPLDPSVVYAATDIYASTGGSFLKSTDAGLTWEQLSPMPTGSVSDLAISYTEPEILFASNDYNLYKSINQGIDWERAGSEIDLHARHCLTSPRYPSWVWVPIALSTDGSETWQFDHAPNLYDDASAMSAVHYVMGPDWLPCLISPSEVDGIWTHVEDMPPRIMMAGSHYDPAASMLHFSALVTDPKGPQDIETVEILYEGSETGMQLHDDGTNWDAHAHDGVFILAIPVKADDPVVNIPYSLIAKDKSGFVSRSWPDIKATQYRGEP